MYATLCSCVYYYTIYIITTTTMITKQQLQEAITNGDKQGFTTPLKWKLERYIVAFTHNKTVDIENLYNQANFGTAKQFSNINVWWWMGDDGQRYIDISTSFDDFNVAIAFGRFWWQIAIWDNVENKEYKCNN